MTVVWGADQQVSAWVAYWIWGKGARGWTDCRALGVFGEDGQILAGVVFHDWDPNHGTIEISAAARDRRWLTREVMSAAFVYAFDVARMVIVRYSADNLAADRIWTALGADRYRLRGLWAQDCDAILATLTRQQWEASRFNRSKVNRGQAEGADAPRS